MPLFSSGTASFRRFLALGPVPSGDKIRKALEIDRFRAFQSGSEERRTGWCDWRNPLIVPAKEDMPLMIGDWAHLGLRIDTRKVPASTLKAHLALRMETFLKESGAAFVGKETRVSMLDEIKAELLPKQTPVTKLIEIAWHTKKGVMLVGSTSKSVIDEITTLMVKSFGLELHGTTPMMVAGMVAKDLPTDDVSALEPLALADSMAEGSMDVARSFLGQEFAIWLWYRNAVEGGRRVDDDGSSVLVDDSIQMAAEHGTAQNVTLKKGAPAESEAAYKALTDGMKPTKIKLRILNGDLEWLFTLNAQTLDFSSLKLPPIKGSNAVNYAADRMFLIEEALRFFDDRYAEFLHERMDADAITQTLGEWAKMGLDERPDGDEDAGTEDEG